jgi:membrane-bound metal-dependent hydrolase YbcI (DUF457 family)
MDIISHGLWGGAAFGRRNKKSFWTAFGFGVMPDLLSFGLFTVSIWLGWSQVVNWGEDVPNLSGIPSYVYHLYDVTHSLVVFLLAFALVWIVRRKPLWELSAWGLHIALDIFTHSNRVFPTPFLWPISGYRFDGIRWSDPMIFFPNVAGLLVVYSLWYWRRRVVRRSRSKT